MREGAKYGDGGLYQLPSGKWAFQRSFTIRERGRAVRIRKTCTGRTAEEAIALGALLTPERRTSRKRKNRAWVELHRSDHVTASQRRGRGTQYIYHVLKVARDEGWSDFRVAQVIQAQLTPARVRRDIFGPCAYCGTWVATHVDHVVPVVRGGGDEPENLVSACLSCNASKGDSMLEDWRSRRNMAEQIPRESVA